MTPSKEYGPCEKKATMSRQILYWIVLGLALLLDGCTTTNLPYFEQEASGNSWVTTLPKGTKITVKDQKVLAPAFEEIKDGELLKDCVLVSKEYLNKRDQKEIEQIYLIQELKIKKDAQ